MLTSGFYANGGVFLNSQKIMDFVKILFHMLHINFWSDIFPHTVSCHAFSMGVFLVWTL